MSDYVSSDTIQKFFDNPGKPTAIVAVYVHDGCSTQGHIEVTTQQDAVSLLGQLGVFITTLREVIDKSDAKIKPLPNLTPHRLLSVATDLIAKHPNVGLRKNRVGNLTIVQEDGQEIGFVDLLRGTVELWDEE